jgi:hypothetical protein
MIGRMKWNGKTLKIPFRREKVVVSIAIMVAPITIQRRNTSPFSTDNCTTRCLLPDSPDEPVR